MIKKEKKIKIINKISKLLLKYNSIYLINIFKINTININIFRKLCFEHNTEFFVVKNSLLNKSIDLILYNKNNFNKTDLSRFKTVLSQNTSLLVSNKENLPAKIISMYRKKINNFDSPVFKAAYVQDTFYIGVDKFNLLLKLKSKEELILDIVYSLKFMLNNILYTIIFSYNNLFLQILQSIIKK